MERMVATQTCPSCHTPLPANSPQGMCPGCLMQAGFFTGDVPSPGEPSRRKSFVPPAIDELARLFPQFEIVELLGHGGMGAVYKARQPSLDRMVALKILPPDATGEAGFAERFTREARALARLNHPNIVTVYDFGQAGALHYLVMEYIEGGNLRQLQQPARFTPREALRIVPQICEALQFAHDEGVVHRDIKPENVMLDRKGRVKITDFGLARILGVEVSGARLTGAKDVMGTPHYMAPEQIEHPQEVDHRADIYSLGVVFYELLTGELPLGRFSPPSRKVHVDVRLDEVVLHALEKEPDRRYQHASEVKCDVEQIATGTAADYGAVPGPARSGPAGVARKTAVLAAAGKPLQAVLVARWTARVLGTLLAAFFGLFVIGEGLPPIGNQPAGVQLGFVALGLVMAGFVAGWKREGTAALLIASGWVVWTIAGNRPSLNLFQAPLPVAALYAYCWWATRGRRGRVLVTALLALAAALALGRLVCPTSVFVRGTISDAGTGLPIAGAELFLQDARNDRHAPRARTDARGHFDLYVGWYRPGGALEISAPGYAALETNLGPRRLGVREVSRNYDLEPMAASAETATIDATPMPVPPVVVSSLPRAGTGNVDPALRLLRITFSKPIREGGANCTPFTGAAFPESAGQPRLEDGGRTWALPVRLQPGKVYGLWVNENDANFVGREGLPAVSYLLIFETRKSQ